MPIYEFYCADCNTLFSFFTSRIDTSRRPVCPRCGRRDLSRRPSRFATPTSGSRDVSQEGDLLAGIDENVVGQAIEDLTREVGDSEDPRRLAAGLRAFGRRSGLEPGPRIEELLSRLEGGGEIGDLDGEIELGEDESPEDYFQLRRGHGGSRPAPPEVDDELYFF